MTGPVVVGLDEQDGPIDVERWTALARNALVHEGASEGELNLVFVDEGRMRELNRTHMGHDRPTDVLSFPIDAPGEVPPVGEVLLGDVVVCPEYAARQAHDARSEGRDGGDVDDELALLVVHGVLHVLGHDHAEPDESALMAARERALLDAYHRP